MQSIGAAPAVAWFKPRISNTVTAIMVSTMLVFDENFVNNAQGQLKIAEKTDLCAKASSALYLPIKDTFSFSFHCCTLIFSFDFHISYITAV